LYNSITQIRKKINFYTSHSHYGKIKIAGGVNMENLMEQRNVRTLHYGTIKTSKTLPGRGESFDLETDSFGWVDKKLRLDFYF
jgi:hypothetical protein